MTLEPEQNAEYVRPEDERMDYCCDAEACHNRATLIIEGPDDTAAYCPEHAHIDRSSAQ